MPITPYGNTESGDYPAIFTGCFEGKYPRASRLIFGFAILNADRQTPHDGPDGEGLYAVAVCNKSEGTNPKSKPFKIRKAMLQPEEFQDLRLAVEPPPPEHFTEPYGDRQRVLDIRVERREKDGRQVSLVTHIRRPRDGEWQCIEGQYEGAREEELHGAPMAAHTAVAADKRRADVAAECASEPNADNHAQEASAVDELELDSESFTERPFWLQEDGTASRGGDLDRLDGLPEGEILEFWSWNTTTSGQLRKWRHADGGVRVLTKVELKA